MGALYRTDLVASLERVELPDGESVASFAACSETANYAVATPAGRVFTWGDNAFGELGLGGDLGVARPSPTLLLSDALPADDPVVQLSAGAAHFLARTGRPR